MKRPKGLGICSDVKNVFQYGAWAYRVLQVFLTATIVSWLSLWWDPHGSPVRVVKQGVWTQIWGNQHSGDQMAIRVTSHRLSRQPLASYVDE
jgi:hypothetical protein